MTVMNRGNDEGGVESERHNLNLAVYIVNTMMTELQHTSSHC